MNSEDQQLLIRLIKDHRWAALACLYKGEPLASMVAYVPLPDMSGFILHLSRLATHTRGLMEHPQAAIVISENDNGSDDPQTLARLTIQGKMEIIKKDAPEYAEAKQGYLAQLPDAEQRFGFADFLLFRLRPQSIRLVGGFARAHSITPEQLQDAAKSVSGRVS